MYEIGRADDAATVKVVKKWDPDPSRLRKVSGSVVFLVRHSFGCVDVERTAETSGPGSVLDVFAAVED